MTQEATIRRGVRNARYAAIPNHVFEDDRLSMEARWLLCYLLSKPDNWTVVIGDIIKKGNCGRDKARKMIAELVDVGYAEREQQRADGKFGSSVLVIFDEPRQAPENQAIEESVALLPQTDLPATASPSPVSPSPVKSAHSNNLHLANTDDQHLREGAGEPDGVDPSKVGERAFRRAFAQWPTYVSDSEPAARKAWDALPAPKRLKAIQRQAEYAASVKAMGRSKFCSYAVYLAEERWEKLDDVPIPVQRAKAAPFGPGWAARVMMLLLAGPAECGKPEVTRDSRRAAYRALVDQWGEERAQGHYRRQGLDFDEAGNMLFPDDFEDVQWRDHILKHGWPEVRKLYELAQSGQDLTGEAAEIGQRYAEQMAFVPSDWPLFDEWKAFFAERSWPWPVSGRTRGLYFPACGPSAIHEFERAIYDHAA